MYGSCYEDVQTYVPADFLKKGTRGALAKCQHTFDLNVHTYKKT